MLVEVGLTQKSNKIEDKTLLFPKKLLAFLRGFLSLFFIFTIFFPVSASAAGFWEAFLKVFQNDEIQEVATKQKSPAPAPISAFIGAAILPVFAKDQTDSDATNELTAPNLSMVQNSTLTSPANPQGVFSDDIRGSIITYTVKEGDNLSVIARSFGVTVNTILWANDIKNVRTIKPGDELIILPVSGVKYVVKKGDTIESVAKKFKPRGVDLDGFTADILGFNGLAVDEKLTIGEELIIPEGEFQETQITTPSRLGSAATRFSGLPQFPGYYLRPIVGGHNSRATKANPRGIHGFNGVDLTSPCGTSIMASASGTVLIARSSGWNGGYGRYVVIAHANGTQTLYGHMLKVSVTPGQEVQRGEIIGAIGSSGNSTGCHVHFEIRGAQHSY